MQLPDLSKPRRPRLPLKAGRGVKGAMAAVLVVPGMCIVGTPPRQLQSLNGLDGLFEQMRKRFGSTVGYELDGLRTRHPRRQPA